MPGTQEAVLEAWKAFIAQGVILEDKVRPEIARSWLRCKNLGLDPWSSEFPQRTDSELQEKRAKYAKLWALAAPVMNYIYTLLDSNISICDPDGFVFDLITPLKYYPRTLGTYINEATCGSGAVTITLHEKLPIRTDGYEHYRIISQTYSTVSSPIIIDNILIAVLNGTNPFGNLPEKALPMIVSATKIIERLLLNKPEQNRPFENSPLFSEMIDCCSRLVVIVDRDGTVLAANQALKNLLNTDKIVGKSLGSLIGKSSLSLLMDNELDSYENLDVKFKKVTEEKITGATPGCRLLRKKQVRLLNGEIRTMLIFEEIPPSDPVGNHNHLLSPAYGHLKNSKSQDVDYIGRSTAWTKVDNLVRKTAQFPSNVLLLGETGTGKEVVAKEIHRQSQRKGNFVAINCGALPKDLLHSELFGYEEGAFTGARAHGSIGKFEYAHEGTLLLDEIGEMPLDMQVALLRFLQERTITRINSNKSKKIDVRIIAATNKDMAELVRTGQFRQDLYYRLNVIEINLPPLRDRKSDIPLLAEHFVTELAKQFKVQPKRIGEDVLQILYKYEWPGNVRELKNVIEKAMILSGGSEISPESLPDYILHGNHSLPEANASQSKDELSEREQIIRLLEYYNGNIVQTAKALNMARNTLYRKIEKFNIKFKTSVSTK